MKTFRVRLEIDLTANTAREAAEKALEIHRERNSREEWGKHPPHHPMNGEEIDLSK